MTTASNQQPQVPVLLLVAGIDVCLATAGNDRFIPVWQKIIQVQGALGTVQMGRGRVQKQLLIAAKKLAVASTGVSPTHLAISVSSSSTTPLAVFPPREAYSQPTLHTKQFFPEIWAALQPPPTTALSAFAHRIGLASILDSPQLIQQVCTHSSFTPFQQKYIPNSKSHDNAQLAFTGNTLMGLFAAEHVNATYPYLPTRVMKAAVTAYVGPLSSASVAQEMGATPLLRWHRQVSWPD